jgi:hypothetical protein
MRAVVGRGTVSDKRLTDSRGTPVIDNPSSPSSISTSAMYPL